MRKVLHLSDLHFGRARPELEEPLLAAISATAPDLVAISGDLTQRARNAQFEAARDFIARIPTPVLVVPGNHDVPLDNIFLRFLMPWRRYRRWIDERLEPVHEDGEICVAGVNTVNPFSWQRGRIGQKAVRRACDAFGIAEDGRIRIVVAHHPFEQGPDAAKRPMHGAARAMDALAACGTDIVLSGHLHLWGADPFAGRKGRRGALQVQAGTGLSTRMRGEENDFNLLTLADGSVRVERFAATPEGRFARVESRDFTFADSGWIRTERLQPAA